MAEEYFPARGVDGRLAPVTVTKDGDQRVIEWTAIKISMTGNNTEELLSRIKQGKDILCEISYDLEKNRNQELSYEEVAANYKQ